MGMEMEILIPLLDYSWRVKDCECLREFGMDLITVLNVNPWNVHLYIFVKNPLSLSEKSSLPFKIFTITDLTYTFI